LEKEFTINWINRYKMSISFQVLGKPGWDNGLFVKINSGTKVYRLLFDCGENILKDLSLREVQSIDYLFLSHLHIDHIAGFDYFFRRNYDRDKKPVYIYGPEDTVKLIHNRMRGFKWNLVKGVPGLWYVTETDEKKLYSFLFKTSEGYSVKHKVNEDYSGGVLIDNPDFSVKVTFLNHIIPSAAYLVKEKSSLNISKEVLAESGLKPGPWLEKVRDLSLNPAKEILIDGRFYKLKSLRERLLKKKTGESISYLSDFIYEKKSVDGLKKVFKGCDVMICESQYLSAEKELAKKNYHLTAGQAAGIAKAVNTKRLILFHISDRYRVKDYPSIIEEAREIFPETYLPDEWNIKY
jgi:ribonuclease Z